jgi:hypothetical protein
VLPRTAEVVIVTASGQDKKNWFTIAMERFEQDVRNLRMGITDAIQSGINRGNNAVGSFKVQSRAAVQRIGGEVRSFGGVVTSAYLNRVDSGISRMRSGDATARAFENNTGFTGTIGRFGGGLEAVGGGIEWGLAVPLTAIDVLVGRPVNTATNNAIPQKFMGDAALTIAGAATLRPTATTARGAVAAESNDFVGPLIGKSGYRTTSELSDAIFTRYQAAADRGYANVQALEAQGLLVPPKGVPLNTYRGQLVDDFARRDIRGFLVQEGIENSGLVSVNRRLYDSTGTSYRIPDLRVVGTNRIYDLTVGNMKWLGLFGQVNRFYKWMTAGFTPQPGLVGAG